LNETDSGQEMTRTINTIARISLTAATIAVASTPSLNAQNPWKGTIQASGNVLFGAADGRLLSAAASVGRADSSVEVRGDVRTTYADSRGGDGERSVTARALKATMAVDYRPMARFSPFLFGAAENSLQQRIASRFSSGVGVKATLRRAGEDETSVSAAVLWERTSALDPDPLDDAVATHARWSLRLRERRRIAPIFTLSHVTFYQPTVDQLGHYVIDSNTTLAADLTSRIALTVTLQDRYDTEARARGARSNHDGQLLFGVRAGF
jgi:hypothetical protein